MAAQTGVGVGEAVKLLDLAGTLVDAPATKEALVKGVVSPRQARAVARAEKVSPGQGERLLAKAPSVSVSELETDANRVVAAASSESDAERAARLRKKRCLRTGVDGDGMGYGHWLLEPVAHARLMSLIDANKDTIFAGARRAGVRESSEAYAADALAALADLPSRPAAGSRSRSDVSDGGEPAAGAVSTGGGGGVVGDWSFTKMIVRVDLGALDRGELAAGEVCEIAGQGPIPVADAWKLIDGGAFIAAVTTKGSRVDQVVHLGRKPTVLQRTALEWLSAGECSTEGCTSPARIEIDHIADWADTHITTLSQLASPCGYHHDLKTHHGYRFGPLLPSGKRRLIPPDDTDPPDGGPADRSAVGSVGDGDQPGLFDSS